MKRKITAILLTVALMVSLGLVMAAPVAATTTTDLYYSGNGDFDTETVAVSTSFVNYGLGGVTYGTANPVVNCWTHSAWASVKATYSQLVPAYWVSSSYYVEDPVGDSWRQFVSTFEIPAGATNLSAVLDITVDNSYEVSLNGTPIGSDGIVYGYATDYTTDYWSAIETWTGSTIDGALQTGTNTLTIVARNWAQTGGTTGTNPTGLISKLTVQYEEILIEVDKDYRYTNVCFERDNDHDGLFNEDPEDFIDNDLDGDIDEDDIDCPGDTSLGDLLPMDNGNYQLEAVIHPKNDKVRSYNPGQYYAVSTVDVLVDIDELVIVEDWGDCGCTEPPISVLNPRRGGGRVVIVQVGGEIDGVPLPDPSAAYQILDATSDAIVFDDCTATATLYDVKAGTTVYMYVKFGPGLKGETWAGPYGPCENTNTATAEVDATTQEETASANLIVVAKD